MKIIPANPINEQSWVVKKNKLNEMYLTNMSLQELRIFSVYLSLIDKDDESTKRVVFSLKEFSRIADVSRQRMEYYKDVVTQLAAKSVSYGVRDDEDSPYQICPLFIKLIVEKDEYGEWRIILDANEKAMPLLFGFKSEYFRYKLWNVMRLKGKNQVRMYEILKQYEKLGRRVIQIDDLRGMLGMAKGRYKDLSNFKKRVLRPCQEALAKYTDITFEFDDYSKRGRKVDAIKFTIIKNENYQDPLKLDEIIDLDAINKKIEAEEPVLWTHPFDEYGEDNDEDLTNIGHFENVSLTGRELEKLFSMYGNKMVGEYIKKLSTYMASSGKTYNNHAATIMRWIDDDLNPDKRSFTQ